MRRSWIAAALVCLAFVSSSAHALVISLSATPAAVAGGGAVSVDIVASGLGEDGFVSAYDFGIDWDPAQLAYANGSFAVGTGLGSVPDAEYFDFTIFDDADAGSILPFVVSLLEDVELAARQANGSVLLASFGLVARRTSPGLIASIGLSCNSVAGARDDAGIAELLDVDSCDGTSVTIEPAGIPAPGTLLLFGLGLIGLAPRLRRIASL
jgi:hypothetical protein